MIECVCCGDAQMKEIWELEKVPLTGIYVDRPDNYGFPNFHDETLMFCESCTHMQLSNPVSPELLYLETYTHRTSGSAISSAGNDFLEGYLRSRFTDQGLGQILEIGCNDGLLLKSISDLGNNLAGFDPVLEGKEVAHNVTLAFGFGEAVNYSELVQSPIELVISAHTFEHIVDPRVTLERLQPFLSQDAQIVIEVPSSISMVKQARLDQVFPQHVNYYSPESMSALLAPLDFVLCEVTHNFRYWGGTQILRFTRRASAEIAPETINADQIRSAIALFDSGIQVTKSQVGLGPGELVTSALGAAQMLPILAYHMGYEFFTDQVVQIIDDNPHRQGRYFPSLPLKIGPASEASGLEQVLITAIDSGKVLVPRALELGAKNIVVPLGCF